jgi:hypothetical protein
MTRNQSPGERLGVSPPWIRRSGLYANCCRKLRQAICTPREPNSSSRWESKPWAAGVHRSHGGRSGRRCTWLRSQLAGATLSAKEGIVRQASCIYLHAAHYQTSKSTHPALLSSLRCMSPATQRVTRNPTPPATQRRPQPNVARNPTSPATQRHPQPMCRPQPNVARNPCVARNPTSPATHVSPAAIRTSEAEKCWAEKWRPSFCPEFFCP